MAAQDIVAVDVGGTFTDICGLDGATGALRVAKVPSTADPIDGVMAGVRDAGIDLSSVALFSHGTTVATNALITRRFRPRPWSRPRGSATSSRSAAGPRTTCGTPTRTSRPHPSSAATASRCASA